MLIKKIKLFIVVARVDGIREAIRRGFRTLATIGRQTEVLSEVDIVLETLFASRTGGSMVDVGAHFGESLRRALNAGWSVLAFEPLASTRRKLQLLYGDSPNLKIDNRAVSDVVLQSVPFYASEVSSGISGLSAFHETHLEADKVATTTLAIALTEHAVASVNFLKIDTEGHDLPALRGFPWNTHMPDVIVCEFEDRKTIPLGYSYSDMGNYLLDRGYRVLMSEWFPIVEYGGQHRWRSAVRFPAVLEDLSGWGNFVAVKDEAMFLKIEQAFMAHVRAEPRHS